MSARGPSATGWFRGLLILFAVAGPAVLSFSYFDRTAQPPAEPVSHSVRPVERLGERPQVASFATSGMPRLDARISNEASRRAAEPGYFARPSARQLPPAPFKFLGKIKEGDETLVLLYSGGQTLTARGIGPLDDDNVDYVVDAFEEAYLVLRHVSDGESQIIQLVSLAPMIDTGGSAEDTPQD